MQKNSISDRECERGGEVKEGDNSIIKEGGY